MVTLRVGAPVYVSSSCVFADKFNRFECSFVTDIEDLSEFIKSLNQQKSSKYVNISQTEIIHFCPEEFGIEPVMNQLLGQYKKAIRHDR